jgi:hypothetical protein
VDSTTSAANFCTSRETVYSCGGARGSVKGWDELKDGGVPGQGSADHPQSYRRGPVLRRLPPGRWSRNADGDTVRRGGGGGGGRGELRSRLRALVRGERPADALDGKGSDKRLDRTGQGIVRISSQRGNGGSAPGFPKWIRSAPSLISRGHLQGRWSISSSSIPIPPPTRLKIASLAAVDLAVPWDTSPLASPTQYIFRPYFHHRP